jgi:MtN3 and saliva related transmembrane protein
MNPDLSTFFGYPAAVLTTIAFVPQAWQSWRTRDLSGISLPMYALFTLGVALWLGYGLVMGSLPIIVANSVTLVLASVVLWLKILDVRGGVRS